MTCKMTLYTGERGHEVCHGTFTPTGDSIELIPDVADDFTAVILEVPDLEGELATTVTYNFVAILSKAWRFTFEGTLAPDNPWRYSHRVVRPREDVPQLSQSIGLTVGSIEYATHCQVAIRIGRKNHASLKALLWRLGNTMTWCCLPNRRKLVSDTRLSRATWDAVSVNVDPATLQAPVREATPGIPSDPSEDPSSAPSDPGEESDGSTDSEGF